MQRAQQKSSVRQVGMYSSKKREEPVVAISPASRVVVMYIKATDHYGHIRYDKKTKQDYETGDRMTEIFCGEIVDGKMTKNEFSAFIQLEDPVLLAHCRERYDNDNELSDKEKIELKRHLQDASRFADIEQRLMDFAFAPGTQVVVHFKWRVLEHLRAQLSAANREKIDAVHKEVMRDLQSDIAAHKKAGLYDETIYPQTLDEKGHAAPLPGKADRKMETVESKLGITTQRQTKYSAKYDGRRLMVAYINCQKQLQHIPDPAPVDTSVRSVKKRK